MAVGVLVLAAGAAVTDWWAVWVNRAKTESIAKPLVLVALLIFASIASETGAVKVWVALALLLGLAGDIYLLPQIDHFTYGLAAFLGGHVAYIGAAFAAGTGVEPWFVLGAMLATAGVGLVGRPIAKAVSRSELHGPVIAYVVITGLFVTFVAGTGIALAFLGALLFTASDGLLGWTRFVNETDDQRWLVHATYHLGQALLVVGLLGAGQ